MAKTIFATLYFDIKNFFESYFLKMSNRIAEDFFIKAESIKNMGAVRWICLFFIVIFYLFIWLLWLFLPLIISLLLYYGRLF